MIVRYCGAMMGLSAFGVATLAGVAVHNPPRLVLSRALWALVVFCMIGLLVGWAAQVVVNDYAARRRAVRATEQEAASQEADADREGQVESSPAGAG